MRDERGSEMSGQTISERPPNDSGDDTIETLSQALDRWRARIDELLVHSELADHELRDRVRDDIDRTENVYLAARSRLSDARSDAHADVTTVCAGTQRLVRDLQQAFQAAEAAFHRGRPE